MELRQELENIKGWLHQGAISYEQAEKMAKPIIKALNEKSIEIAKKCGVRPKKFNFASLMR
ncbi:MAG: hypothetical protein MJ179_02500 [Treponema sp.]|nr:hypothetical protein [Treponema sp.]